MCLSTVRELQEALEDVYTNGSSTPIVEVSIPVASFQPKSVEALDDLSKLLDKEIREFTQDHKTFPGMMVSFSKFSFNTTGAVETELLLGRDKIEDLKERIMALELEELLPVDLNPHTLTVFQGCRQDQGVKQCVEGLRQDLFLGAICAPKATLRLKEQSISEGKHHKKIFKTFTLRLLDSC